MSKEENIQLESVSPLSPHNEALYETGKEIMKNSIKTGREFFKFMISTSTGAIPIYLGLLQYVFPTDLVLSTTQKIMFFVPFIMYMLSSIIFFIGFVPQVDKISLNSIDDIQKMYSETIVKNKNIILVGAISFIIAVLISFVNIYGLILSS